MKRTLATTNNLSNVVNNTEGGIQSVLATDAVLPSEVEQQEIITFESDDQVIPEHQILEEPVNSGILEQHTDSRYHSIISFLARPVRVGSVDWAIADGRGKTLYSALIPSQFLYGDASWRMFTEKLSGFTSFRATAVVRIQAQCQPFMQGRLVLASIPMPGLLGPRATYVEKSISRLIQMNHVQLDASKQTEVSLRIPFVSPFNSFDLISREWDWAKVILSVYSPLDMVESTDAHITIWMHFEDVVLGAPTNFKIGTYPETKSVSAYSVKKARTPKKVGRGLLSVEDDDSAEDEIPQRYRLNYYDDPYVGRVVQQSGKVPTKPTTQQVEQTRTLEQRGFTTGVIQRIGAGAQAGWSQLGKSLPFLSPLTDLLGGLSKSATSFIAPLAALVGFSKPHSPDQGLTVVNRPVVNFGIIDGNDHSHVLALVSENNLTVVPNLAGTSADEMSFDFLKKQLNFIDTFIYSINSIPSKKPGELLWRTMLSPSYKQKEGTVTVNPVGVVQDPFVKTWSIEQPSVLGYISSMFTYWTGSLVFNFKFVKTDFHSGRVRFTFHPFGSNPSGVTDSSLLGNEFCYSVVVDLRDKNEVSLSVPFVSTTPWKQNINFNPIGSYNWEDVAPYCTGELIVTAVTPLILGNKIVKDSIEVLVEVRAGDDFALSAPYESPFFPYSIGTSGVSASDYVVQQGGLVHAASGLADSRTAAGEGHVSASITGNQADCMRRAMELECSGETFTNFRVLTRRFGFIGKDMDTPGGFRPTLAAPPTLRVSAISLTEDPAKPGTVITGQWTLSSPRRPAPIHWVSSMYAFVRGSYRVKVVADSKPDYISARLFSRTNTPTLRRPSSLTPIAYEQPSLKGFAEFQFPFYGISFLTSPWPHEKKIYDEIPDVLYSFQTSNTKPDSKDIVRMALAGGDDFDCLVFLGVPFVVQETIYDQNYNTGGKNYPLFNNEGYDSDPAVYLAVWDIQDPIKNSRILTLDDLQFG